MEQYYKEVFKRGRWPQVENFMKNPSYDQVHSRDLVPLYTEPIEEYVSPETIEPSEGEQLNLFKKDPVSKRMQNLVERFEAGEINEKEFEEEKDKLRLVPGGEISAESSTFLGMVRR